MVHKLCFHANYLLDLQVRDKPRLEQVRIQKGDIIEAAVRPYVQETAQGLVETADLYLGDDGVLRAVPMGYFSFE